MIERNNHFEIHEAKLYCHTSLPQAHETPFTVDSSPRKKEKKKFIRMTNAPRGWRIGIESDLPLQGRIYSAPNRIGAIQTEDRAGGK